MRKLRGSVVRIGIRGHTAGTGDRAANVVLSRIRARAIAAIVLDRTGVARSRVRIVASGAAQPLATNLTEAGQARNRRVEVRISLRVRVR